MYGTSTAEVQEALNHLPQPTITETTVFSIPFDSVNNILTLYCEKTGKSRREALKAYHTARQFLDVISTQEKVSSQEEAIKLARSGFLRFVGNTDSEAKGLAIFCCPEGGTGGGDSGGGDGDGSCGG